MMLQRPGLLLLLPLLLVGCQPAPDDERPRSVTVIGEGELQVAPDLAVVRLAIQARDTELEAAQEEAGRVTGAVLEIVDALEIDREQVRSTELQVRPEFDWREGEQHLRGYLVHREVRIEVKDLANLGPLLERAMASGVNDISAPELQLSNPREVHREALRLAAEDARANAATLVETLEVSLGEARHINALESGNGGPIRPLAEMRMQASGHAQAEENYETGQITVRARVSAEFALD